MLAVAPTARGRGVGRRLVERCVDRTRNLGLDELVLVSGAGMATAHRLYESMGFARDEALDWSPQPDVCLQGFRATVPPSPSPTPPRPSPAHGPGSGDGR